MDGNDLAVIGLIIGILITPITIVLAVAMDGLYNMFTRDKKQ